MIQLVSKGSWKKTEKWLQRRFGYDKTLHILKKYAKEGVDALKNNTPVFTGVTAESWYYDIEIQKDGIYRIIWANKNVVNDYCNVALILQLGHATSSGTWVEGVDYINPALAPIFNDMADRVWQEIRHNP